MKRIMVSAMALCLLAGCGVNNEPKQDTAVSTSEQTTVQTATATTAAQTTAQTTAAPTEAQQTGAKEEDIYTDTVNSLKSLGKIKSPQSGTMKNESTAWLSPLGTGAIHIEDLDGDGVKELISLSMAEGRDKNFVLTCEVYTITGGQAKKADTTVLKGFGQFGETVGLMKNQYLLDDFYAHLVTVKGKKYIVCEYTSVSSVFSDGIYEAYWALEYKGGKLVPAFGVCQSGAGSAELEYLGYKGTEDKGELLYAEVGGGKYGSLGEAVKTFFKEQGIACANTTEGQGSILTRENDMVLLFNYNVTMTNHSYGANGSSADFTFKAGGNGNVAL